MVTILLNNKNKFIYLAARKSGSTLLNNIAESYKDECSIIDIFTFSTYIKNFPETPIYIPYREPLTRFKSGFDVFIHTYLKINNPRIISGSLYMETRETIYNSLLCFDALFLNMENNISNNYKRPYHLYNPHMDHYFGIILLLMVYGYNVKPVKMNEFSTHVLQKFNDINLLLETSIENNKIRHDSFNASKLIHNLYFDVYLDVFGKLHSAFLNRNIESHTSFDEWMAPEIEIFNYLDNGTLNKHTSLQLLNKFIEHKIYLNDSNSILMSLMMMFINSIEFRDFQHLKNNSFLKNIKGLKFMHNHINELCGGINNCVFQKYGEDWYFKEFYLRNSNEC